jgi:hypothetical protein
MSNSQKSGKYQPPSAEKRLEKQLNAARIQSSQIKPGGNYTIEKDPRLKGLEYLIWTGGYAGDKTSIYVIHRRVGQDFRISDDDWVISTYDRVIEYMSRASNPEGPKLRAKVRQMEEEFALKNSLLEEVPGKGLFYKGKTEETRNTLINEARDASKLHAKVQGGKHLKEWLLYLPSWAAAAEVALQDALAKSPGLQRKRKMLLTQDALYVTTDTLGNNQRAVPWMHGIPLKTLKGATFQVLAGMVSPNPNPQASPEKIILLKGKTYSDLTIGDEAGRAVLLKALENHGKALAAFNVATEEEGRNKDKSLNKSLKAELQKTTTTLEIQRKDVKAAEGGFTPAVKENIIVVIEVDAKKTREELMAVTMKAVASEAGSELTV